MLTISSCQNYNAYKLAVSKIQTINPIDNVNMIQVIDQVMLLLYDFSDFILSGSETYHDLYHSIIETPFDGLERFQHTSTKIVYPNMIVMSSHDPPRTPNSI